jgi:hypothetical protein
VPSRPSRARAARAARAARSELLLVDFQLFLLKIDHDHGLVTSLIMGGLRR